MEKFLGKFRPTLIVMIGAIISICWLADGDIAILTSALVTIAAVAKTLMDAK